MQSGSAPSQCQVASRPHDLTNVRYWRKTDTPHPLAGPKWHRSLSHLPHTLPFMRGAIAEGVSDDLAAVLVDHQPFAVGAGFVAGEKLVGRVLHDQHASAQRH